MPRLADENPTGRLDVALARGARSLAAHCGLSGVYEAGAGEVVETLISRTVSDRVLTPVEIADACGLLPKANRPKVGARRVRS